MYGLGQLGEVEGKIYRNWQIIDEIPHEARLRRKGLDFGYSNDPRDNVGMAPDRIASHGFAQCRNDCDKLRDTAGSEGLSEEVLLLHPFFHRA